MSVDGSGNVFVVDHGNHTIRKITSSGVVSTLAGSSDGRGTNARFRYPSGVAVGRDGTVYVADTDNQVIKSITADGEVATIGGSNGGTGSTDGSSTTARFLNPKGLAVSADGKLYIADLGNRTIRLGVAQ